MKQWLALFLSVLVVTDAIPLYAASADTESLQALGAKVQESTEEQAGTEEIPETEKQPEAVYFESAEARTEDEMEGNGLPASDGAVSTETETPLEQGTEHEPEAPSEYIEPVTEAEPTGDDNPENTETETEWYNYYLYLNETYHELTPGRNGTAFRRDGRTVRGACL